MELKKKVFAQIDELIDGETIVASSSSCLPSSAFTESLKNRHNILVAHPVCTGIIITHVAYANNEYSFHDMYCMYVFVYKVLRKIN